MKLMLGRGEEMEAHVAEAMRLSPRDPLLSRWYHFLGVADLFIGRVDRAVDPLRKSVELNPNFSNAHFFLAASLALQGRDAEARDACVAGRRLDPSFSVAKYRDDRRSDDPTYLAQRERIYEGMSKAGVPEE